MTQREFRMDSMDSMWTPWIPYGFHVDSMDSVWTQWIPCGFHGLLCKWLLRRLYGIHMDSIESGVDSPWTVHGIPQ